MFEFSLTGSIIPQARKPAADFFANPQFGVLGSVIKLDGRASSDPDGTPLTFTYSFILPPIGSQVANEGFRQLEDDGSVVSFSPDIVGRYSIGLVVSNGTYESDRFEYTVDVRAILVPHARGLVPDGKWIWSFIRDVWTQVDNKEMFETLWSALIQITGTELIKTYQIDFNKSIRDIQDLYQRRWLHYEPKLTLDVEDLSVILVDQSAGTDASTGPLGDVGTARVSTQYELYVTQGAVRPSVVGKTITLSFGQGVDGSGEYLVIGLNSKRDAFRLATALPISTLGLLTAYAVPADEVLATDTISIPAVHASVAKVSAGRVMVVGSRAFTVLRSSVDLNQRIPMNVITTDRAVAVSGMLGIPWRLPHTLISKTLDFGVLGVHAGDLLVVAVLDASSKTVEVPLQVVGVDRNRLGFVLTPEPVVDGTVAEIPFISLASISNGLQIPNTVELADGSSFLIGDAKASVETVQSVYFKTAYCNKEIPASTAFVVGSRTFRAQPRYIIRNTNIPVDTTVTSIPVLQEYIKQPELVQRNGLLYQVRGEQVTEIDRKPAILVENLHYVIDESEALRNVLTFRTGTNVIDADGGDFIDRGVLQGDSFIIEEPLSLAGEYPIAEVLSRNQLLLVKSVPDYKLSSFVQAKVSIRRGRVGKFIRLIPRLYTAKNPAPARLWGEVTLFDNAENVERNFGLLVGLKKSDLTNLSSAFSYRQAVAGMMYAYTRGSAVDKIRLGASILLGLPFTEHRGIIRSIENDYRIGADGVPTTGRIFIEDVDQAGEGTGIFRIYTFPLDQYSALAGVDTNPATGVPYVVGDIVEAYSALAKGVEVLDAKTSHLGARTAETLIQSSHSARIRVNDNIFLPSEIKLVSDFLKKITPSYIALILTESSEFFEKIDIVDRVRISAAGVKGGSSPYSDSAGLGLPHPLMFDYQTNRGVMPLLWDGGPAWLRRAGRDLSIHSNTFTVASGGLISPRNDHEKFERPRCRVGDSLVVLDGYSAGTYEIASLTDTDIIVHDTTVETVDGEDILDDDGQPVTVVTPTFVSEVNRHFAIIRPIKALIHSGTAICTSSVSHIVCLGGGLRSVGAMPGDLFIMDTEGAPIRYRIVKIFSMDGENWDHVQVTPTPLVTLTNVKFAVYRPELMTSPSEEVFEVEATASVVTAVPPLLHALAECGDEIEFTEEVPVGFSAISVPKFRATIIDPVNMVLNPVPPLNRTFRGHLIRRDPFALDMSIVKDVVDLTFKYRSNAHAGAAHWEPSGAISFLRPADDGHTVACYGLRAGDLFKFLPYMDSQDPMDVDIGYGHNVFPIAAITGDSSLQLTVALPGSGNAYWQATRRR